MTRKEELEPIDMACLICGGRGCQACGMTGKLESEPVKRDHDIPATQDGRN